MAEWNYNYKSDNWTMPIGPKAGKTLELGKLPVNIFGAVF